MINPSRTPHLAGVVITVCMIVIAQVGCKDSSPRADSRTDSRADIVSSDAHDARADLAVAIPPPVMMVETARYETDLAAIAKPRVPGSPQWQTVQDLCFTRLEQLGYSTSRQSYATGVNVIGRRVGAKEPDKEIVISAHYDHIADCPGADDNASGVAGLLESARVLSSVSHDRTLVVACWDEEERQMLGSRAWVAEAKAKSEQIVVAYVFEMIGFSSDQPNSQTLPAGMELLFPNQVAQLKSNQHRANFITSIHDEHPSAASRAASTVLERAAAAQGQLAVSLEVPAALKTNSFFDDLQRSDHVAFWEIDVPALQITDTGEFRNPNYHCLHGQDVVSTLDTGFAVRVIKATVWSALALLKSS
jgi:hypothetical protein